MDKHFIKVKNSLLNSYLFSRMTCIDRGLYISIFDWKTGSPGQIFCLSILGFLTWLIQGNSKGHV